jgi:hypothetical protein
MHHAVSICTEVSVLVERDQRALAVGLDIDPG